MAKSYFSMQFLEYLLLQNIHDIEAVDLLSFDTTEELVALGSAMTFLVISYSGSRVLTNFVRVCL
jgi:hypothetical protein